MTFKVNIKQLGKKKNKIAGVDFPLSCSPKTVRELIRECVRTCVSRYVERAEKSDTPDPLTSEQIADMSEIGKIAFGINYGDKLPDEEKTVTDAYQAYEDGLFRVFIGEDEAGELDSTVSISEGSEVTFIRLVMLAGRMW
ncbi:MAG TPA: hypothetical protein DDX72_03040 [Ruminococcaceae bacterium]|nr:hypothetical protein [Oscillospiraceae bacterium]